MWILFIVIFLDSTVYEESKWRLRANGGRKRSPLGGGWEGVIFICQIKSRSRLCTRNERNYWAYIPRVCLWPWYKIQRCNCATFLVKKWFYNVNFLEFAEPDSFFCFTNLMSEIRDFFIKSLDESDKGINMMMNKLLNQLRSCDLDVWLKFQQLELKPQYYSFR